MIDIIIKIAVDAIWSALAAAGFAMLFNVPRRTLLACMLAGAVGHATRTLLMSLGMTIIPATLAGAVVIGFFGEYCSRRWRAPAPLFTVSGSIPMVPGSYAYRAMLAAIRITTTAPADVMPVLAEAGINFVTTGLILAALALGIAMPQLLFRPRKPITRVKV
jgi:uncharacterized membrane protein YjjB (DUF3815 family)